MPAQVLHTAAAKIESTLKAREVEGALDLYYYRPIWFRLAEFFAHCKISPAAVSLLAGLFGVVAGHLYFYSSLGINIAGMILHVCANALDNADGQLARLTRQESRNGRIIDSVADHLGFASVYIHLTLRCALAGASPAIWVIALGAAISHALQGAAADYYRSAYLYFAGGTRAQIDCSFALRSDYQSLTWRQQAWDKFLLALYLNFTVQQEMLAPNLKKLRDVFNTAVHGQVPAWLQNRYRDAAGGMLKWWRLLMTNTRMLVLFVVLFIGQPVYYFWFELIPLNVLFVYLMLRQEKMAQSLERLVVAQRRSA